MGNAKLLSNDRTFHGEDMISIFSSFFSSNILRLEDYGLGITGYIEKLEWE